MRKAVLAILAVSIFAAPVLLAQKTPPSPDTIVQHLVARAAKELQLSGDQQTVASACFLPAVQSNQNLKMVTLKPQRQQLATDIKNGAFANIVADAAAISKTEDEIRNNNVNALACFLTKASPPLTTEQLSMLVQGLRGWGLDGHGNRGGVGGPGRFGGRGLH